MGFDNNNVDDLWREWEQLDYYNFYKKRDKNELLNRFNFLRERIKDEENGMKDPDVSVGEIDYDYLESWEKEYYAIKRIMEEEKNESKPKGSRDLDEI